MLDSNLVQAALTLRQRVGPIDHRTVGWPAATAE
jgi:hypothetical protein